ncbi:sporulation histidine kinase inhibitor Sda [Aliibacillus thermotolerans]|uniref:Sporulation histidine kinase inhibitor Sda n=1 Tax=Aliibacillus thermotolerans TaxID=1834418 RepID=A0ABW0U9Q4_9BACI|nr:sporulation histidine kinase inhibitor Sda [Aliibacillus thermotolerans]MDA3129724.1 sporulation histidine kinase inhibitor Sda [Aliibacillus thermotolerans]
MYYITDRVLMEAYKKALELDLEEDFIDILHKELVQRNISIPSSSQKERVKLNQ